MGSVVLLMTAAAVAQLSIGKLVLKPADFLDGRAIAGSDGVPVVMLTLSTKAAARVRRATTSQKMLLNGKPATVRFTDATIELDGQKSFPDAIKVARAISGKPPLPDSIDE